MEADDFGLEFLDELTGHRVERRAVGEIDRRCRIQAVLLIVGRKPLLPERFTRGIGRNSLVTEEVQVDRRRDPLTDDIHLLADLLRRKHRAR